VELDPEHAAVYEQNLATTIIAAPITTDERRLGVLSVYADRAPIFVEDDLWLIELMAAHTALLLEARSHATTTNSLRAREESARLKEEFLSAAAHDLRTPLTVVLGQAELLERRVARDPAAPPDAVGISRMVREARRLRDLVTELLDAQRLEMGAEVMDLEPIDLRTVLESVRRRYHDQGIDLKVTTPADAAIGSIDEPRFEQVIDNLVENAIKYTSSGRLPEVELAVDAGEARILVTDHGVGVPEEERDRIFDRFYRATNVQGHDRKRNRAGSLHLPAHRRGPCRAHLGRARARRRKHVRGRRPRRRSRRHQPGPGGLEAIKQRSEPRRLRGGRRCVRSRSSSSTTRRISAPPSRRCSRSRATTSRKRRTEPMPSMSWKSDAPT
jgi:signal transduction histidine kinase